ncbi:hypothetical protein GCM10023082_29300 [Streptomyces tremellae]|uniref:Uncharacterized protein n=1 Tax=Streptomyces tremellae TaxID=1124239 RepID=A0ABP7F3K2_9ACTN
MLLSEEDAVAEQSESCSPVHPARDPLGLGVDALGRAVAVGKCEPGDNGVGAAGEGVQVRQVGRSDLGDPAGERFAGPLQSRSVAL